MGLRESWRQQRERERAESAERQHEESQAERVHISTLPTAPHPFEEIGIMWGEACDGPDQALRSLRRTALGEDCDGVLGVGLCGVAGSAGGLAPEVTRGRYLAYGTGVRWTDGPGEG